MEVYKLKYSSEEDAIADLKAKGIIDNDLTYNDKTEAVVYLGTLIDKPATFDEEGNVLTEATYLDGYHVDVMVDQKINFENEIQTDNPKHSFA